MPSKFSTRLIIGSAVTLAASVLALSANHQPLSGVPKGVTVVHVSSQRLSSESAVGRAGITQLQALQQEKSVEVRSRQQALDEIRLQLNQAPDAETRGRLQSQEALRRTEFERAAVQAQIDIQTLQRQLSAEITVKVKAVLDEVLAGTDVKVVLQSDTSVLWAAPGLDLTALVIERLNAREPRVSGEF